MVKSLNDEVLAKMDEIVDYIEKSESYQKFKAIEAKMQKNTDIMERIAKIKKLQKEAVKLEYNKKDGSEKEKEISLLLDELQSYPIYQEYSYLLEDLNNTFQSVRSVIENYINNKLN